MTINSLPTGADTSRHEPTEKAPTPADTKQGWHKERVRGKTKWVVGFTLDGKRRRKYFATEREAKVFYNRHHGAKERARRTLATLPADELEGIFEARELARAGGFGLFQAVEYYANNCAAITPTLIVDAVETFLKYKETDRRLRPRSLGNLKSTVERFATDPATPLYLGEVGTSHVRRWLASQEVSPRTKNGHLTNLKTFSGWAVKLGLIHKDPTEPLEKQLTDATPPEVHKPEVVGAMLEAAREVEPRALAHIAIGYFAGLRPEAELLHLTWPEVDREAGLIRLRRTKTRRPRQVPISDNLAAWLDLAQEVGAELPLRNHKKRLDLIRGAAGDPHWPHDVMRKSFCSYHYEQHQDAAKTAKVSGHSVQVLLDVYADLVLPAEAKAFWGVLPC